MGLPGGSNFIPKRFYRHTFVVAVDTFEESTLMRIFTTIGEWHFTKYTDSISRMAKGLAAAIINVYKGATQYYLPTPDKSHYRYLVFI